MRGVRVSVRRGAAAGILAVCSSLACGQGSPTATGSAESVSPAVSAALSAPRPSPAVVATPEPELVNTPVPDPEPVSVGQPSAQATPSSCPPLTGWASKIHWISSNDDRQLPAPEAGATLIVDSTPQFGGRACNSESNGCGGRRCEDPNGGAWSLLEGDSPASPRESGYQFRIGPLLPGKHRWRVCPLPGARDAEGVALVIGAGACSEGVFQVP